MPEEEKPKKRGRPRIHPLEEKKFNERGRKTPVGGRPKSFQGKYDMYDPRVLEILSRKARIFCVAAMGGTQADCARAAGISQSALSKLYGEEYFGGKLDLKMRLRYAQFMKAYEGDTAMLKHLGVAHLEEQKESGLMDLTKNLLQSGIDKLLMDEGHDPQELLPKCVEEKIEKDKED